VNRDTIRADTVSLGSLPALLKDAPGPDAASADAARARQAQLTKPPGSLGRLEDLVIWLAGWQRRHPPTLDHAMALVFAGNHGVAARGISAFPAEVTAQMVANFAAGGAAINQLCDQADARLRVIDLDLDRPTADFTTAPAMQADDCSRALAKGFDAVGGDADVLLLGEMGIGNTTSAAALGCALFGGRAEDWVGPGTGLDDAGIARKQAVVADALHLHGAALNDPAEALRRLGGREIAAIAGAILAARLNNVPVILDGFVCSAAASVLHRLSPAALDHCIAGHLSAEPAHARMLDAIGKAPLLDLGMRLGEGSGAAVALCVLRAALCAHNGMATFAEAGIGDAP
jgi:nicotinate-nucleotide--dimethylbenzimidazole phosphoribosyltransferase